MAKQIAELIQLLEPEPWRLENGFSTEMSEANGRLFASKDPDESSRILNEWLRFYQPCLFGRAAAKNNLLAFCILTPDDLHDTDEHIRDTIGKARLRWTQDGYFGRKSGFVVLALSPDIAVAKPGPRLQRLAERLCSLYLREEIESDKIYLEDIFLEVPSEEHFTWRWKAGVNYFSSQGDKRWWHDHRIPGGIAFSVNSVGHMVKSARLVKGMQNVAELLDVPMEGWSASTLDSLSKALGVAMKTIDMAADSVSGKATLLLPLPDDAGELPVPQCPVQLPETLANRNFCEYLGFYHTDHTVPSCYFTEHVERPHDVLPLKLDFTYLFRKDVDNPAFEMMGEGQRIRADEKGEPSSPAVASPNPKAVKADEERLDISECPRLVKALQMQ